MKVCAVIAALNEARTIREVVEAARTRVSDVIVIDDGSGDATGEIARAAGAVLITHEVNRGKGASLRDGFRRAREGGFDAVIVLDADGQHDPAEIPVFIRAAERTEAQLIVGNRMDDITDMPLMRILTNRVMSALLSFLIRQRVPDSQNGYRLVRADLLEHMTLATSNFEVESEMLVCACRHGARIESVPVRTIYGEEASFINPVVDTYRFLCFFFRNLDCLWKRHGL